MEFRRAVEADINRIMEIIEQAKFSLKAKESTSGKTVIQTLIL